MSKIIPRTTHTVENQTQTIFVCVNDTHIGVILRDKETFERLDFFELDLSDRATALYIDDFDELLAFVTANDKGCVRSQIPHSENTDNKETGSNAPCGGYTSSGVINRDGEALFLKSANARYLNLMIPPADCEIIRFALDIAFELNAGCDPEHIHIKDFERLALFFKHLDYSQHCDTCLDLPEIMRCNAECKGA